MGHFEVWETTTSPGRSSFTINFIANTSKEEKLLNVYFIIYNVLTLGKYLLN